MFGCEGIVVFIGIMEYSSLWVCLQTRVEERKKTPVSNRVDFRVYLVRIDSMINNGTEIEEWMIVYGKGEIFFFFFFLQTKIHLKKIQKSYL